MSTKHTKKKKKFRPLRAFLRIILGNRLIQGLLVWLVAGYIRLAYCTSRWQWHIPQETEALLASGTPVIYAFWHGRLLMMPYSWLKYHPKRASKPKDYTPKMHVLISEHRDGKFISDVSATFALNTIAGSSSRGAMGAMRAMLRTLRHGHAIAITPDGPRGPRHELAPGAIALAQKTGTPIIPWSFSTSRGKVMGSWDHFLFALPFGKGVFICGSPFYVTQEDEAESAAQTLQHSMVALDHRADTLAGRVAPTR